MIILKALITGASGFVGGFLTEFLIGKGLDVLGISRSEGFLNKEKNIKYRCDILNADGLENILQSFQPDYIIHLAAPAFIPTSLKLPKQTYDLVFLGTLNLLECVRKLELNTKILYVSSADVYGNSLNPVLSELDSCKPINPYSSAKACAELMCQQYFHSYGIDVVIARPFNHTGPYQSPDFVCSDFAYQIASMTKNSEKKIFTGNIEVKRDFMDVRDVVDAYYKLLTYGQSGEIYNVSSGRASSIREIITMLFNHAGITKYEIVTDPQKVRSNDVPIRIGDRTKIFQHTGWKPVYVLNETIEDLYRYWKEQLH